MLAPGIDRTHKISALAFILAITVLLWRVLSEATVTEDAYITFRVVHNFVEGYGLRWNVTERVQTYTNPLWMLIHIPFYALFGNIHFVTLAISLICTAGTVWLLADSLRTHWVKWLCVLIVPLALSRSFVVYSTSGLENPLTHLLFAAFVWVLLRGREDKRWFWMVLWACLSMVNRLDTLFFYAPIFLWLAIARRQLPDIRQSILGSLPLLAWLLFSLIYYGFVFPNTKYAKLNGGFPEIQYINRGINYVGNLVAMDTIGALCVGLAVSLLLWRRLLAGQCQHLSALTAVGLGVLGYVLYVVYVGGNHLTGRFWSLHVTAAIWVVAAVFVQLRTQLCLNLAACLLLYTAIAPNVTWWKTSCKRCFSSISNVPIDLKLNGLRGKLVSPFPPGAKEYRYLSRFKNWPEVAKRHKSLLRITDMVGIAGFHSGPSVYYIDTMGIADPLLGRLPGYQNRLVMTGHIKRRIPKGYSEAALTGNTAGMHTALAEYYQKLRLIITSDIWSVERFKTIVLFNAGTYDHLLDEYIESGEPF